MATSDTTTTPRPHPRHLALLPLLALGACAVAPPSGPMVLATPPQGKALSQFQGEDANCRNYATAAIGGTTPTQAANQSAVGSAVLGTALGAGAGAAIGSVGAAAGAGAAVGGAAGLLIGSAIGAQNARASGVGLQQAYDVAYAQCMASQGNTIQAGVIPPLGGYAYGAVPYASPYYWPYNYYAPYWGYYGAPTIGLGFGFGVYRGWGYRPWYYGRPGYWGNRSWYYGRPGYWGGGYWGRPGYAGPRFGGGHGGFRGGGRHR